MNILVSGIKPTGSMHLGNYLGAIKNWVELQDRYHCYYFIADLHALTIKIPAEKLNQQIFELVVDLLALGIDPKKSLIFRQSDVRGHTELGWIFDCLMPVSELERMTQYKDKSTDQSDNINAGLLTYPCLMAADILLYRGQVVPVGEDQIQHLELTRIAARKFNNRYGNFFSEVKPILSPAVRVMSLNASDKKMSKSLGESSYIAIRDDQDTVAKKIKRAVTDQAGALNLLELYSYFGDQAKYQEMLAKNKKGDLLYSELKEELTKVIWQFLEPVQQKIKALEKNPKKIQSLLDKNAKQAQKIAAKNLKEIKKIVGL